MPVFQHANFARGTLVGTHSAGIGQIDLVAGHGDRFPNAPFRAVIWNFTDYPDPVDAYWAVPAAAEVVGVTDNPTTNQLTGVERGVETDAIAFDDATKEYRIMQLATAGEMDALIQRDGAQSPGFWEGRLGPGTIFDNGDQMRLAHAEFASDPMVMSLQGGVTSTAIGMRMSDNTGGGEASVLLNANNSTLTVDPSGVFLLLGQLQLGGFLRFDLGADLTVVGGNVTVTHSFHQVTGPAGTQNLDTITGGSIGTILILKTVNDANDVVVRHNQDPGGNDNIFLDGAANADLIINERILALIRISNGWVELFRNNV